MAGQQPYRAFADQKELDDFVKGAKSQAERSAIRKLAKDLGFEDADEMREALGTLRQAQGGAQTPTTPGAQPTPASQGPSESARLQMALEVGAELNLPVALVRRLQGDSKEAMTADAQSLLAMMGSGASTTPRPPGIPPAPQTSQAQTFTVAQLQDAKFVRENADAIRRAKVEGRIVRS